MKIRSNKAQGGYALMMTLFFAGIGLMTLGGMMRWCSTTSKATERNNQYYTALAGAEAATEKVLANISKDYKAAGESAVYTKLDTYSQMIPTTTESTNWLGYTFSNGARINNRTHVTRTVAWMYTAPLASQYDGLNGMAATYRIISNAKVPGMSSSISAAVKQEVQVASIPIFQFAIFYSIDLEVNPGPTMNVTGRVHSNANIYTQPQATLNYLSHVTAVGKISLTKSPLDPTSRVPGPVNFLGENDSGVSTLSLPIGTNNSPAAVRAVVEIPPSTELPSSLMGQQRYYNKADIIVLVSNTTVTVKSGAWNNFGITMPFTHVSAFLSTNASFMNKRENKTVKATQIDVGKLITWSSTNTLVRPTLARDVNSIYVADLRTQTSSTEPGVRLVNGQTLPPAGLTVATPNPAYIVGNYNAPASTLGTTNTLGTKPASVVADAITILSPAWNDANANSALSSRLASSSTVNAAFLAGIVQSDGTYYSGGVENFPRFLEDWSNDVFTYNGSMVVMYPSQYATKPWGGTDVYSPPTRRWAFDLNFMDATKLPPGTPQLLTIIRAAWSILPPDTIM